jgi:hypothetical protein
MQIDSGLFQVAAMDFFTVPALTFGILYSFFVMGHVAWSNVGRISEPIR